MGALTIVGMVISSLQVPIDDSQVNTIEAVAEIIASLHKWIFADE
jgi:hypothetical protein